MNGSDINSFASVGVVFVEVDGLQTLRTLDELKPGMRTTWGVYQDLNLHNGEYYHIFVQKIWDQYTERYEDKQVKIASSALVHPRTKLHHDVVIEPRAIIASGAELLPGAWVSAGKVIKFGEIYHHLTIEGGQFKNSTVA